MREFAIVSRRARVGVALLGLCLATVLAFAGWSPRSASAAFPGANGLIAFERPIPHSPKTSILTVAPDGSGLRKLTTGAGPSFSPDGELIVFAAVAGVSPGQVGVSGGHPAGGLYLMKADGSRIHALTHPPNGRPLPRIGRGWALYCGDGGASFSPDGARIVFVRACTAIHTPHTGVSIKALYQGMFVVDLNGRHVRELTRTRPRVQDLDPKFSPDGRTIVFVRQRGDDQEIYTVDANGLNLHKLTRRINTGNANVTGGQSYSPDFSPDSSRIVFIENHDFTRTICPPPPHSCRTGTGNTSDVFVMNRDGSSRREVTTPVQSGYSREGFTAAAFSPDGTQIVALLNGDLYTLNPDGSGLHRLTYGSHGGASLSWQPLR